MAKIKHLAIICMDPDELARFYCEVFDLKVVHRSATGGVFLTDGYLSLALLQNKAEGKSNGLNHFGFQVEDADVVTERLKNFSGIAPKQRPADRPFAELRATDPEGNAFDLSVQGYAEVKPGSKPATREPVKTARALAPAGSE